MYLWKLYNFFVSHMLLCSDCAKSSCYLTIIQADRKTLLEEENSESILMGLVSHKKGKRHPRKKNEK